MTAQKKILAVLIGGLFVGSLLTACGGGGGSSTPSPTPTNAPTSAPTVAPQSVTGFGVDGYIAGATVFLDLNNNGVADGGEPSTTTDAQGKYTLSAISLLRGQTLASSQLVLVGGTDTGTGKPFIGSMTAKPDVNNPSANITPLTSLANAMISSGAATSLGDATEKLGKVLGISSNNVTADPMVAVLEDPAILQKAVAMQKAIEVLAAAEAGANASDAAKAEAVKKATSAIAQNIAQLSSTVNASQPETLPSVAALVISTVNTFGSGFTQLTAVQKVTQAAADMAQTTEVVIAAQVAELITTSGLTNNSSAADIANAVQQSVNTSVAGLANLQNLIVDAATNAQTAPAGVVLSVADQINTNPTELGGTAQASLVSSLFSAAVAAPVVNVSRDNANVTASALSDVANAANQAKVGLPTAAPTPAPVVFSFDNVNVYKSTSSVSCTNSYCQGSFGLRANNSNAQSVNIDSITITDASSKVIARASTASTLAAGSSSSINFNYSGTSSTLTATYVLSNPSNGQSHTLPYTFEVNPRSSFPF